MLRDWNHDWFINICILAVIGLFACNLFYGIFMRLTHPVPVVVQEKREPRVEYHYNMSPAEFADWQYRQQIEEIDRQVTERIRNNHLSDPAK